MLNCFRLPGRSRHASRFTDGFKFTTIFFVPRRASALVLPPPLLCPCKNREPLNRGGARHFRRPDASLDATRGPPDDPRFVLPASPLACRRFVLSLEKERVDL